MRIDRLFPIFCVSEVTVRNEKHRLPAAEVVKGKGRISRQAVALLSVLGLAFSTLLAVVPLSAPAVEQGGGKFCCRFWFGCFEYWQGRGGKR